MRQSSAPKAVCKSMAYFEKRLISMAYLFQYVWWRLIKDIHGRALTGEELNMDQGIKDLQFLVRNILCFVSWCGQYFSQEAFRVPINDTVLDAHRIHQEGEGSLR